MLVARLVEERDIDALYALASEANPPLTNLPAWRETLVSRVMATQSAIWSPVERPGAESYMFALEDTSRQRVVGTATLRAWAGMDQAYYTYRRETLIHASPGLGIRREVNTLALSHEISEASQLCAMALAPEFQQDVDARLLLRKARLAFMRLNPQRFSDQCVVAFTGVVDDSGQSPFWNSVGQHFFGREYHDIHTLAGRECKSFIAEMMPQLPLYEELLTPQARGVIGHTHQRHLPNYQAMIAEGFNPGRHVDIFDAGPVLQAETHQLKTLRDACARSLHPESMNADKRKEHQEISLLASGQLDDFRALITPVEEDTDAEQLHVSREVIDALHYSGRQTLLKSECDPSLTGEVFGNSLRNQAGNNSTTGYASLAERLAGGTA